MVWNRIANDVLGSRTLCNSLGRGEPILVQHVVKGSIADTLTPDKRGFQNINSTTQCCESGSDWIRKSFLDTNPEFFSDPDPAKIKEQLINKNFIFKCFWTQGPSNVLFSETL